MAQPPEESARERGSGGGGDALNAEEQLRAERAELVHLREEVRQLHAHARAQNAAHERMLTDMREANQRLVLAHLREDRLQEAVANARVASEKRVWATRAKDELIAMLGHELRNPLAPIRSILERLRVQGETALARERELIERHAESLAALVDELLDIARVSDDSVVLEKKPLELSEIVATARAMVEAQRAQKGHALEVRVAERGLKLEADRFRLVQAFANLLGNAIRFTPAGGLIELSAERRAGRIVVRVRDNGIGIAPEMLPRIFQRFVQQTQGLDRADGGLGLGLAIVSKMVALHGGTVSARSEGPGHGSEFEVELPAFDERAHGTAALPRAPRSRTPGPQRVLVVDDNRDAADTLAELLSALGYDTQVAYDGRAALALAEDHAFDSAVLDIGLPEMDGYQLARRLREKFAELRLIAVTGYGQEEERRRSQSAGFDAHLLKPVSVQALEEALDGASRAQESL